VNGLRQSVEDYVALRRAMGYKLQATARLLADFASFMERSGATTVTSDAALGWAMSPAHASASWWAARLGVVRGFAAYLATLDPATEVPAVGLLPHRTHRPIPYLFTEADVATLLTGAGALAPPLRAATYTTVFGLLATSGLRVGEVIRLGRGDVDLDDGLLTVRLGKFDKSRELPLHPTTTRALSSYAHLRDRLCPHPRAGTFFVSTAGTALIYNNVRAVFLDLANRLDPPATTRRRPRIHDLRHTFAVTTLLEWYRAGLDVDAHLPLLSAYLGHTDPAATYWYLQAAPELLAVSAERLETTTGEPS